MALNLEQLRPLLWESLSSVQNAPQISLNSLGSTIFHRATVLNLAPIPNIHHSGLGGGGEHLLRVAVSELTAAGLLVPGNGAESPNLPWLEITPYGHACIPAAQLNPYDPDGYLARLAVSTAGALDPVARDYITEALDCFRRHCFMASAVMTGGAAERSVLLLIEQVHHAMQDPTQKARFEKAAIRAWNLKARIDALKKEMTSVLPQLPDNLRDDIENVFYAPLSPIRRSRNDAGHPAGTRSITREQARDGLLLFSGFCERAYALTAYFQATPI